MVPFAGVSVSAFSRHLPLAVTVLVDVVVTTLHYYSEILTNSGFFNAMAVSKLGLRNIHLLIRQTPQTVFHVLEAKSGGTFVLFQDLGLFGGGFSTAAVTRLCGHSFFRSR